MRQLQKEMEELKLQLSEQGDGEESGSEEDDASGGKSFPDLMKSVARILNIFIHAFIHSFVYFSFIHSDEAHTPGSKPRRRRRSKGMSKEKKAEIISKIESDRKALEEAKDMAEEQRRKAEEELRKREEGIKAADEEQRQLAQR